MTLTKLREREEGFTLIELLVVIIIIGILAAIAIPTFLRQRERGWEATAQSDLKNAAIAQESVMTETGAYTAVLATLQAEGYTGTTVGDIVVPAGGQSFCMEAQHASGGDPFAFDSGTGQPVRDATC